MAGATGPTKPTKPTKQVAVLNHVLHPGAISYLMGGTREIHGTRGSQENQVNFGSEKQRRTSNG